MNRGGFQNAMDKMIQFFHVLPPELIVVLAVCIKKFCVQIFWKKMFCQVSDKARLVLGDQGLFILETVDHFRNGCFAEQQSFFITEKPDLVIEFVCKFAVFDRRNSETVTAVHQHSGNSVGILYCKNQLSLCLWTAIKIKINV